MALNYTYSVGRRSLNNKCPPVRIMVKTKREYILATCFLTVTAAILSFCALGTQNWVVADVTGGATANGEKNTVSVGLFGGTLDMQTVLQSVYELSTVCLFDKNICALLCGSDLQENLRLIYNHEVSTGFQTCGRIGSTSNREYGIFIQNWRAADPEPTDDPAFINAGIWLCTILFLIVSALFGLLSATLAVWNTASNPYQVYLSIFGMYIYLAISCFCSLLVVILWGVMFGKTLKTNVPIYETLVEDYNTTNRASLGYSYWLNLVSLLLYMCSIALLYVRDFLISKEPKHEVQLEHPSDPMIYFY